MKKYIITKKGIAKYLVFLFLLLNLCAFAGAITPVIGQPYSKEKIMMRTAVAINVIYIYPLSKVFGNRNILTLPFYFVRDKLYYTAYNMYPKDETEKEIHWHAVRYWEYEKLYSPMYEKYFKSQPEKLIKNNDLFNWTNEIYYHLNLLSQGTIKDPTFKEYRFGYFNQVLHEYLPVRFLLFKAKNNYNQYVYLSNDSEIQQLKNLVADSIKLESFCRQNEPEGIIYWNKDSFWYTNLNLLDATISILQNSIKKNEFNCNSPYLNIYLENRRILTFDLNYSKVPNEKKKLIRNYLNYNLNEDILKEYNTQCSMNKEQ